MGIWAWSRLGFFAVVGTDKYRVSFVQFLLVDDTGHVILDGHTDGGVYRGDIAGNARPVAVSPAEQDAHWKAIRKEVDAEAGGPRLRVPEIPATKPPVRGLRFSEDGYLLVMVSMPSVLSDGTWIEPEAYDVFRPDAHFLGRLMFPMNFRLARLRQNRACGVLSDRDGVEAIRCYQLQKDWAR
jgi:hypothetical protein